MKAVEDIKKNMIFKLDPVLRTRFKKKCKDSGVTMQAVFGALIEEYTNNGAGVKVVITRSVDTINNEG